MKTTLLVIDPQKIYTDKNSDMFCKDATGTIARINSLIEDAQSRKQKIVVVRHIHKTDGSDLGRLFDFTGEAEDDFNFKDSSDEVQYDDRLNRPPGAVEILKNRYSAFAGTKLHETLRESGVQKIAICGFMTNFCCESTARDALDLDYYVDFITDATGTPGTDKYDEEEVRTIVGDLLSAGFANVHLTGAYLKR